MLVILANIFREGTTIHNTGVRSILGQLERVCEHGIYICNPANVCTYVRLLQAYFLEFSHYIIGISASKSGTNAYHAHVLYGFQAETSKMMRKEEYLFLVVGRCIESFFSDSSSIVESLEP